MFHPECAIPTTSWYDDPTCTELYQFIPILECLSKVSDVRPFLQAFVKDNKVQFSKANQVLRGGKIDSRAQSQPHFKVQEEKYSDSSKKRKDKRSGYKKRTTSERRNYKPSSNYQRHSNLATESMSTSKYQSKYSSSYKFDEKESYSAKHSTTKLDKTTPKTNKYYSKTDCNVDKYRNKHGSSSKYSAFEKQSERHSSRKRERSEKYRSKQGSRKSSRTKYSSYRRQNSKDEGSFRHKERGSSTHTRPQSAKDPSYKAEEKLKASNSNCDYKNPDEFHKLRYSLATKNPKPRRPSSAKRKDENPLQESYKNPKASPEFTFSGQGKLYNYEKSQFLENVESKDKKSKESNKQAQSKFSQYELSKNKIYESRKSSHREGRKRSSSKDRTKDSPSVKNSENYKHRPRQSRSRSSKAERRSQNRSSSRVNDKHSQKVKPSTQSTHPSKASFHNTASLKFNNILKDMGTPSGVEKSSQFFNYTEKVRGENTRPTTSTKTHLDTENHASRPFLDIERHASKYTNNMEISLKSKDGALKPNEIFRMNSNNNHHYNYMYNTQGAMKESKSTTKFGNNDSYLNTSARGKNHVISASSINKDSKISKKLKMSSRGSTKPQNPSIPFPNSEKHYSSKLNSGGYAPRTRDRYYPRGDKENKFND